MRHQLESRLNSAVCYEILWFECFLRLSVTRIDICNFQPLCPIILTTTTNHHIFLFIQYFKMTIFCVTTLSSEKRNAQKDYRRYINSFAKKLSPKPWELKRLFTSPNAFLTNGKNNIPSH